MREETNLDIFSFRNQGTQPKYHDVYPELEARLFQGALDDQVAIVTGAGRGMLGNLNIFIDCASLVSLIHSIASVRSISNITEKSFQVLEDPCH